MAGNLRFDVRVEVIRGEQLPELQARLKDLSPAFEAFIPEWAGLNKQVFDASEGHESTGAQVDTLVFWEPLRPASSLAKRRKGQSDQIMVATGDLMRAMTSPDLMFQDVKPDHAIFGSPLNFEEVQKVGWNWRQRQAIFFSNPAQNALRRITKDYLEMGGDFQAQRAAQTVGMGWAQKAEMAQMDADFEDDISSDDGGWWA